jgi:hypothetical protein
VATSVAHRRRYEQCDREISNHLREDDVISVFDGQNTTTSRTVRCGDYKSGIHPAATFGLPRRRLCFTRRTSTVSVLEVLVPECPSVLTRASSRLTKEFSNVHACLVRRRFRRRGNRLRRRMWANVVVTNQSFVAHTVCVIRRRCARYSLYQ